MSEMHQIRFPASVCPSIRPSVRSFVRPSVCFWHGRRVAATTTRRDGEDRGGLCCRAFLSVRLSVRPSLRWRLTLTWSRKLPEPPQSAPPPERWSPKSKSSRRTTISTRRRLRSVSPPLRPLTCRLSILFNCIHFYVTKFLMWLLM